MNRWVHAAFAAAALGLVVTLFLATPRPAPLPRTGPPGQPVVPLPPDGTGAGVTPLPPTASVPGSSGSASGEPLPSGTTSPAQPCPTGAPETLTVLTFNIHGGLGGGGLHLDRIAAEIEAWRSDVVLLQEVDRHRARTRFTDQPALLARRLGMFVVYGSNVVRRPPGPGRPPQEYGTAVLSRHPVQRWSNRMLPNRRGLEQRGLLVVTLDVGGGQLVDVANTHLQHTRGDIRIVQMQAVRDLLRGGDRPLLLGGDLNATPDSPALGVAYSFLRDPWPVVGRGPGLTVPPNVPRRRIDYVLHDESFQPVSAQVFRSSVSDHRAVRVTFRLPRPPGCS